MSNKRKIEDYETVALTEECSAIIQNKLPPKLKDPGSFSIPCTIGHLNFAKALCDLGASVSLMPLSIFRKLGLKSELKPTTISLQLADRSIRYPIGILEDVLVKMGKIYVPTDFVVLEMEEDVEIPLILGRPFLATVGALIDVKNGKLTLRVGEDKVEFNVFKATKYPSFSDTCYRIDIIDELTKDVLYKSFSNDALDFCLVNVGSIEDDDLKEEASVEYKSQAPSFELTPLPTHLRRGRVKMGHYSLIQPHTMT